MPRGLYSTLSLLQDLRHRAAAHLGISTHNRGRRSPWRLSDPAHCPEPPVPWAPATGRVPQQTEAAENSMSKIQWEWARFKHTLLNQIYFHVTTETVSLVSNSKRKLIKKFIYQALQFYPHLTKYCCTCFLCQHLHLQLIWVLQRKLMLKVIQEFRVWKKKYQLKTCTHSKEIFFFFFFNAER